ncbi:MAG: glycosyltransferase [Candidatus Omnitrophota bacterium]|nr:MAG: glycosyltransferase [Candidatus Omnitrophota bacterium]
MKVLHVVPSYIPAYRYGGSITATHSLCKALADKGVEVSVFTTNIDGDTVLDVPTHHPQNRDGIQVTYYPVSFMRPYCYSRGLSGALKENLKQFNIIHIHSVYLYPTFIAAYWCRRYQKPYILNPFGALDPSMIKLKGRIKKTLYIKFIESRTIKSAQRIHVASAYEKERLYALGFRVPTAIIPVGLNMSESYDACALPDFLEEEYPLLKGKKKVLFLGRLHPKKGCDILASAFKMIIERTKDVYLVIAGSGSASYLKKIKGLFRKIGIDRHVFFTGMLLGEKKLSAFYHSDIFVLPSYGENFGVAALEAMAAKLPVVITNCVGLSPDVEEYRAGTVIEPDSLSVATAIMNLLENAPLRESMGQNGKRLVEERFTWDHVADKAIKVYEELLRVE